MQCSEFEAMDAMSSVAVRVNDGLLEQIAAEIIAVRIGGNLEIHTGSLAQALHLTWRSRLESTVFRWMIIFSYRLL